MNTGKPTWNGKSEESRSNVNITQRGLSDATISGVCLEAAMTVRLVGSILDAFSMLTSWTETYCITGWFSDHVAISGFTTSPIAGLSQGAGGVPIMSAGRAGGVAGANRSKMYASMVGDSR